MDVRRSGGKTVRETFQHSAGQLLRLLRAAEECGARSWGNRTTSLEKEARQMRVLSEKSDP
jgi:hypothetical protein